MDIDGLKGKKIAILGLGQEGQAVLSYLIKRGVMPTAVLDVAAEPPVPLPPGVAYRGGPGWLDELTGYDLLFRSPGVPRMHPKLAAYPDQAAVYSQTKLFFDLCPCPIVAVTGTKGKTTATNLIAEIFRKANKRVWMGGNMGAPLLDFVDDIRPGDVAVLELSSFQAQDLHKSPYIGVLLNVTSDHLDDGTFRPSSHADLAEYHTAKANLLAHQHPGDFAVLHPSLGTLFTAAGQGKKVTFNPEAAARYKRQLVGAHNLENIAAASAAAACAGVPDSVIAEAVAGFVGVPQRLQKVHESGGVQFYDDSASTNPDSTAAAIASFSQPVILIVGGSDKGLDYGALGQVITAAGHVKALVVVGQTTEKILAAIRGYGGKVMTGAKTMGEILAQAMSVAQPGDVVLLSPAAASFDMFRNSKDRGEQFDREAARL